MEGSDLMKIERINENQIRCTLTSLDLSSRNLNLSELAYGSEKARSLFREMILKASNEVGFDAEDIPLMVEAIPLSGESVMLVITKIEDPEELDTRFSKFSPLSEDGSENLWGGLANELLEGADGLLEMFRQNMLAMNNASNTENADDTTLQAPNSAAQDSSSDAAPVAQTRIYRFSSLDQASDAAGAVCALGPVQSKLYKKPGTSQYYLVLSNQEANPVSFSRICNLLAEYGEKVKTDIIGEAYYQEHYEVIIGENALQKLALI